MTPLPQMDARLNATAAAPGSQPRRRWLAVIAACIAIVYLFGVTGKWWPSDDSAVYLGLGRSLAVGDGYTFNGQVNTTFSPGLPLLLAGLEKLVGERGIWGTNLLVALCGLATAGLAYLTLRRMTGDGLVSAAVSAATALSYPFYLDSHRVLSDIPFAAAFWLLLYAVTRRASRPWLYALIGALAAANVLLRAPGVLLLGALALGLLLDKAAGASRRQRLTAAAAVLVPAAATLAGLWALARQVAQGAPRYVQLVGPHWGVFPYAWRLWHGLLALPAAVAQTVIGQPFWYVGLVLMAMAAVGIASCWPARRPFLQRVVPLVVVAYPLALALCLSSFGMRSRYLAPIEPLILLLVAQGLVRCIEWIAVRRGKLLLAGQRVAIVAGLAMLIIVANLPHVARNAFYYSYRSRGDDFYKVIREGRYAELAEISRLLRMDSPKDALVAAPAGDVPALCYLSGRRIVESPDQTASAITLAANADLTRPQYVVERIPNAKDAQPSTQALPPAGNPSSMPNRKELFRGKDYAAWEIP